MDLNRNLHRYISRRYISIALLEEIPLQGEGEAWADRGMIVLLSRYPASVTEIEFSVTLFSMLLPHMVWMLAVTSTGSSARYTNGKVSLKMYYSDHQ
jgi:hypothetical protein